MLEQQFLQINVKLDHVTDVIYCVVAKITASEIEIAEAWGVEMGGKVGEGSGERGVALEDELLEGVRIYEMDGFLAHMSAIQI